jgi:hypothetical protein
MRFLSHSNAVKVMAGMTVPALCLALQAGTLSAAPAPPVAADPAQAVPERVEARLDARDQAVAFDRAGRIREALGFPAGKTRTGKHVRDGFQNTEYDEVAEIGTDGHPVAITQLDANGNLRAAVRFDRPSRIGGMATRDQAVQFARRSIASAEMTVDTGPIVEADEATGGWSIRWERKAQGVRVRGDETRVQLWPDGQVWSLARVEHQLAEISSHPINQGQARQVATTNLNGWFADTGSSYQIQALTLEWVEPNDAFSNSTSLEPPEAVPYRLAWVAEVKPTGDPASYLYLMCVYIDAGDGDIIGGDFVA